MATVEIDRMTLPNGDVCRFRDTTFTGLTLLSYGTSTWSDFTTAYNSNRVVYCKASSGENPAEGDQKRMAFLAYKDANNAEFQYYRSLSTHTSSAPVDEVYVYKITNKSEWSVTIRPACSKLNATGTNISVTYNQSSASYTINSTIANNAAASGGTTDTLVTTGDKYNWNNKIDSSAKGVKNGVAELDSSGKVPSSQLPSYVDDVLEYSATSAFPGTGEAGKIYVALDKNKTYRWSGSGYVEISESLALGTTSSTAFRGDYGDSAYAHAVTNKGAAFSSGLYKITTNSEGHVTAAASVEKSDITGLGIPSADTTYTFSGGTNEFTVTPSGGTAQSVSVTPSIPVATTSSNGLLASTDKATLDSVATTVNANYINKLFTGTGTAGQKGSSSVAYIPTLWVFDLGFTPSAGDIITIKVPVVGVNAGVWLSVDNGTTYYPVAVSGTSGLTTQYPEDVSLQLIYEIGMTTRIYGTDQTGAPAGSSTSDYTGGRWSVLNYYDTNTTYSSMTVAMLEAGTSTSNRSIRADVFKGAIQSVVAQSNGKVQVYGTDVGVGIDQGSANAGKILTVGSNGIVSPQAAPSGLPAVTSSDNGKVLMVANGAWAAQTIPNASGVSF